MIDMRAIFLALILSVSQVSFAKAKLPKPPKDLNRTFLIYSLRTYPGMFASCVCVLSFLDLCEKGRIAGGRVDFGTEGVYYDPLVGENWWEYYFEPISVSFKPAIKAAPCDRATTFLCGINSKKLSMQRMQDLNRRYVKIKPHILEQVESFRRPISKIFTFWESTTGEPIKAKRRRAFPMNLYSSKSKRRSPPFPTTITRSLSAPTKRPSLKRSPMCSPIKFSARMRRGPPI